ncbi:MAG: phosphatidylserine/phosphatidylglycerophosphate/cardiolipin synthase family protein [Akkermansiaceae bacterium]|nr:phosphatidylserine/phosphatidylglycerophosphate/cardiolipin synthase family protein [Akkermansiaceae bacterium]
MKVIPHKVRRQIADWRQAIARELSRDTVGGLSESNDVEIYYDGDRVFEAMLAAIASAKTHIHLEMYMFLSDTIGKTFAEALSKKSSEGIAVKVIYDSIGSSAADPMQWAHMRDAGVLVIEYHPVAPWRKRAGLFGRNHRKNLIVDGKVGFTGGMNIGNPWSRDQYQENAWRDTQIRVCGPAAADLDTLFIESWKYCTDEIIDLPVVEHAKSSQQGCRCMVVGSRGLGSRKQIRKLFSVHLNKARHSVKMTMPYFVPPRRLRKAMRRASQRGVDVAVLLPRDSDVAAVDWLREGLYPSLLSWGVRVIEYLGPVLHAKTMVVDDSVAIIGSNNFDILSVVMNRETAIVIFDDDVSEELSRQWGNDLMLSERVANDWQGIRPWWRLWLAKLGCFLLRKL